MATTVSIDEILREVLDKIVDTDPRYSNRSELVRAWVWEKVMELGFYDQTKFPKMAEAVPAEGA